jgi:hypothetical protein
LRWKSRAPQLVTNAAALLAPLEAEDLVTTRGGQGEQAQRATVAGLVEESRLGAHQVERLGARRVQSRRPANSGYSGLSFESRC